MISENLKQIWKQGSKKIIAHFIPRKIIAFIISAYIRFVYYTSRWEVIGVEHPMQYWQQNKPFIACFWHNRLMMLCHAWPSTKSVCILTSGHKDGQLISDILKFFNLDSVHGSSGKNGAKAIIQLMARIRKGSTIALVPDGPRGPRYQLQNGVAALAQIAKCDILPVSYSVKRYKELNTWDKLIIALPFNKGVFVWGKPIPFAPNEKIEDIVQNVQEHLVATTQKSDEYIAKTT